MDEENQWVLFGLVEVGRIDNPRMDLATLVKDFYYTQATTYLGPVTFIIELI